MKATTEKLIGLKHGVRVTLECTQGELFQFLDVDLPVRAHDHGVGKALWESWEEWKEENQRI